MNIWSTFQQISVFVFDVDGVLTNGTVEVWEDGRQIRRMNIKDGYALQYAIKKGYPILIVSGAVSEGVEVRLRKLGLEHLWFGVLDKRSKVENFLIEKNLSWSHVLFMGDDIPDIPLLEKVGLPCAPADAAAEVSRSAKYISRFPGGGGCVRDVIEKVLQAKGQWQSDLGIASK